MLLYELGACNAMNRCRVAPAILTWTKDGGTGVNFIDLVGIGSGGSCEDVGLRIFGRLVVRAVPGDALMCQYLLICSSELGSMLIGMIQEGLVSSRELVDQSFAYPGALDVLRLVNVRA